MSLPAPVDTQDPVLTTASAARLLGVAVSTAQLWLESGALPSWKTPGGHRRVRLSAVMNLLEEKARRSQAASTPLAPDPADPEFQPSSVHAYPVPVNEKARLAALQASGLVDSEAEAVFDRLTWLATQVTDCPTALITLLTSRRQWFKSRVGFDASETPRELAFCNYAILQPGPLIVEDTMRDARFADNPFVTGDPRVRFYGGVPLLDAGGHALGTLCVVDKEPRRLRQRELRALTELGAIASDELRRRTA